MGRNCGGGDDTKARARERPHRGLAGDRAAVSREVEEGVSCNRAAFGARGKSFLFAGTGPGGRGVVLLLELRDSLTDAQARAREQPGTIEVAAKKKTGSKKGSTMAKARAREGELEGTSSPRAPAQARAAMLLLLATWMSRNKLRISSSCAPRVALMALNSSRSAPSTSPTSRYAWMSAWALVRYS